MFPNFEFRLSWLGLLLMAMPLSGCSTIITAADVVVSTGIAVVGTAADITVAGVKAVAGSGSDDTKKTEKK